MYAADSRSLRRAHDAILISVDSLIADDSQLSGPSTQRFYR